MSDPYLDPQSGILTNKFGLTNQESLDRAESNSVSVRSILLQLNPLKGNFDSEHLKSIHSYLFRDVYEWAGAIPDDTASRTCLPGQRRHSACRFGLATGRTARAHC
jgi:fido (protein-threonine AMPylation protein)